MRWRDQAQAADPKAPVGLNPPAGSVKRQIVWLTGSLIVVSGCILAFALIYFRHEALLSAEQLTSSLAHIVEEQTSRTLQTTDQRLQLAAARLKVLGTAQALNEESARKVLREQLEDLPFVRALFVLDAQGRITFDSDQGNIGVKLADREYVRFYQEHPDAGFHVSAPVRSRTVGTWLIVASRPLRDDAGRPAGVIAAAVEPPYFDALWREIHLSAGGAITLFRRDGVLMMRSPFAEDAMGKAFAELPLFTRYLQASPKSTFRATSPIDGQERIAAYRTLSTYPDLVIVVARSRADAFGPWTQFAALSGAVWLVGALMAALLSTLLYRQLRERERTELRFHQLSQAMPQIVFISDARGEVLFISDQWTQTTGEPVPAALGRRWTGLIHPDDLPATRQWQDQMAHVGTPISCEHRLRCSDGVYRWRLVRATPNRDERGHVISWYGTSTDIDELKLAGAQLRSQTELLRMAGQISGVGGWTLERGSMRLVWSHEASAMLGLTEDDAPDLQAALDFCAPASREQAARATRDCLENGTPFDLELEVVTPAGRVIWVHCMGQAVRDAGGGIDRIHGALQDITGHKLAEQTLRRVAEAAQAIAQHHTLEAVTQESVDRARAIIGTHQATISFSRDKTWAQTLAARSLSSRHTSYQPPLAGPAGDRVHAQVCGSNRALRLTQAELMAHPAAGGAEAGAGSALHGWLGVPLTGHGGENMGLLQLSDKYEGEFTQQDEYIAAELAQLASIAIENVRLLAQVRELNSGLEEKIAQRTSALSHQEALFRTLAEEAPQPIWTMDARGHATFLSHAWYALAGGAPPDWLGDAWADLVHPDDLAEMTQNWLRCRDSGELFTGTRRLRSPSGAYRTTQYRASPVRNDEGEILFWVGIDADITDIKKVEAALRLSNEELEAFSYSISHDLRSPLTTIDGFSSVLARELGNNPPGKAAYYLSRIQASVRQMGQLTEGLLALAQLSRVELQRTTVDLSALATQVLERLQSAAPQRSATVHIAPGLVVQADSGLMRSVMENLLGNAWKFSSHRAHTEISVGVFAEREAYFVRDNGAGFDMANSERLFGPFQRFHSAAEFPGTGIGLATVSRVIARHGGHIWAESLEGTGTTFFFTLPPATA